MKKTSLTTAVVAGLAGVAGIVNVATAVNQNPDGLGQVLIYPYYTVNNDQLTLISIVNTTEEVKAVKVRFLEGRNSQEVLDFNLYLSPFDVWTGFVDDAGADNVSSETGGAFLRTNDTSCTVRSVADNQPVPFSNAQYTTLNRDGGPYTIDRTREGHLEVIEMGVVNDVAPRNLATAATHDTDRIPNNCNALTAAWSAGGIWDTTDGDADVTRPTGGLFGGIEIVNGANGTNFSYNAEAIDGFFIPRDAGGAIVEARDLHFFPGFTDPSLADAETALGLAEAVIFDNGNLITLDFNDGTPDAVTSLFMHDAIFNEYVTSAPDVNGNVFASSEWVITFPTKLLHLTRTAGTTPGGRLPFTAPNAAADDAGDVVLAYNGNGDATAPTGACEPIDIAQNSVFDREEQTPGNLPAEIPFSPFVPGQGPAGNNLCFEAQVVTFNQPTVGETLGTTNDASTVLGSRYARNINLCSLYNADGTCIGDNFNEGWIRMGIGDDDNFMQTIAEDADGDGAADDANRIYGLPVLGFWAANYTNGNVDGSLANYSGLHKHRSSRRGVTVTGVTGNSGAGLGTVTAFGAS